MRDGANAAHTQCKRSLWDARRLDRYEKVQFVDVSKNETSRYASEPWIQILSHPQCPQSNHGIYIIFPNTLKIQKLFLLKSFDDFAMKSFRRRVIFCGRYEKFIMKRTKVLVVLETKIFNKNFRHAIWAWFVILRRVYESLSN